MQNNWHTLSWEQAVSALGSDVKKGLTEKEVLDRQKNGLNLLPQEKPLSKLRIFFEQLRSPLIYILIAAAFISLFLREWADFIVIASAILLNTVVGYFQEKKASRALQELKKIVKVEAEVIREGNEVELDAKELVPGDIIVLTSGNKVPADARLIQVSNLKVNEAPLTGEWLIAQKNIEPLAEDVPLADRDNMVYMGCTVEDGKGRAVVTSIGQRTELGRIASLVKITAEDKTPLQNKLARFSRLAGFIVALVAVAIFVGGILRQKEAVEMFLTSIAVAVAAIPEGLPVATTVILALGMQRILKRKGLVRKLVAAETLGSTSIVATDKTLTLTEGKMEVVETVVLDQRIVGERKIAWRDSFRQNFNKDQDFLMKIFVLSNEAFVENPQDPYPLWRVRGTPTDRALLVAGAEVGLKKNDFEKAYRKVNELPFNSDNKFAASLVQADPSFRQEKSLGKVKVSLIRDPLVEGSGQVLFVIGAPEKLLSFSTHVRKDGRTHKLDDKTFVQLNQELTELTGNGLRVVAAAYKNVGKSKEQITDLTDRVAQLTFVGFIGLKDPIRPEAKETIKICRKAGLRPIIVTGDHLLTAKAVGKELGLKVKKENMIEGKDLDGMDEEEFQKKVKDIDIYARVEPRHKMKIIEAWQKKGQVVAMTGDGINDAPALKKADIGVSLGSGTDVAKEVADLVLLTDRFSIMVAAVEEGRAIIDNVRKVMTYLLSDSFTETLLVGISVVLGWPLPVLAAQILWVNLIEDGLPSIALAFEAKEKDVLQRKPEGKDTHLFNREMKVIIFIIGILTDLILVGLLWWLLRQGHEMAYVRTMIFGGLGINSLFYIFSCRSLRRNIWHINPFSNKFLVLSVLFGFLMLTAGVHVPLFQTLLKTVPLDLVSWLILLSFGLLNIILIEAVKYYFIVKKQT